MTAPTQNLERKTSTAKTERPYRLTPQRNWTAECFIEKFGYLTTVTVPKHVHGRSNPVKLTTKPNGLPEENHIYDSPWSARDVEQFQRLIDLSAERIENPKGRNDLVRQRASIDNYVSMQSRYR